MAYHKAKKNKKKNKKQQQQKTPQYEETEQATESDLDMAGMLELSDQKFKITMINMLRALNEKNRQHVRTDG